MALARVFVIFLVMITAFGCASWKEDPTRNWSASQLYAEAKRALDAGDYDQAVEYYELLEARYPFGRFAQQAQIEIAYAYYRAGESELAITAIDRFIQLNPRHPNLDYAYYLRGLVNANRNLGFLNRLFPLDPADQDPRPMETAFRDFNRLVRDYPDSIYADNALERMVVLRNSLAAHELRVATFYMERQAWAAAANRAQHVVNRYQGSSLMPQALAIMYRSYRALDLPHLAEDALRVLELNYPQYMAFAQGSDPVVIQSDSGPLRNVLERLPFFTN